MKTALFVIIFLLLKGTAHSQCDSINSIERTILLLEKLSPGFHCSYDSADHVYKFNGGEIFYPVKTFENRTGVSIVYDFKEHYDQVTGSLSELLSSCLGRDVRLTNKPVQFLNARFTVASNPLRIDILFD